MSTFISYSRANSDFAVRLAKDLKSAGLDVWLDQLDIPTGARWDDEIERALEKSSIFLIILSPESIESQNVKDEVGYAIDSGKHILPVVTRSCKIPLRLRRFQFVDFSNKPYEDSLAEIKYLLSNTKNLAATGTTREASAGLEIPPARQEPNVQGKNMPRTKQPPMQKPSRTGYLALIFLGICALAVGVIAISSPAVRNLILPPSQPPSIIITTMAPDENQIPPVVVTTITPTETITPTSTPTNTPTLTFTPTVQLNLCDQLAGKSVNINQANGFQGVLAPSGIALIAKGDGTYSFITVVAYRNEQVDPVSGNCQKNTLTFTRTRTNMFIQDFQARLSQSGGGGLSLEGSVTDRASGGNANWYGKVVGALTPLGLCDQLAGKSVNINQTNGFQGILAPSGIPLIAKGDGTYSFNTVVTYRNEQADPVTGNCQNNKLTFTRTRTNVFIQDFQALLSQSVGGGLSIEGSITDRASGGNANWSGQATEARP
jgi:hypothetical protein